MTKHTLYILIFFIFSILKSQGQDIHFSQFYFSPLTLSPAQTGFYNGKYRLASNYRSQWKMATGGDPYVTFSASYDMHILDKYMKAADMTGVGVSAFSDKAGKGDLSTSGIFGSLAYHRDMTGKGKHIFSMGAQGGMVQMGFDPNLLRFGDQIEREIANGVSGGATIETFQTTSITYADVNAGVLWNYTLSNKMKFYLGVSTYHLSRPTINFLNSNEKNYLSTRTSLQGGAAFVITHQWDVFPSILYMRQDASNEVNFGTAVRYNTSSDAAIRLGAWYRYWANSDALIFMTGLEYFNLTLAISYDINVSSLNQTSNGRGSIEVALIYIIKSSRAIVQDVSCPEF
ncbi:MAG: PorP/SprF family type IX secretion system membrane protein [Bacteroidota bacterium]